MPSPTREQGSKDAMLLPLIVILASIGIGLLVGGRLKGFEHLHLCWWALAPIGLAMQLAPLPRAGSHTAQAVSTFVLVASFPVLLVFVARNFRLAGFPLLFIGLALNLAVIAPNGGMPVNADAVRAAGGPGRLAGLENGGDPKHHLMTGEDVLTPLGDQLAIGEPVGEILSVGDVAVYAGLAWFVIATMRAPIPGMDRERSTRPRGYRGKHRPHRKPPAGAPMALRPVGATRSGTAR
jgi:hypothetical protein